MGIRLERLRQALELVDLARAALAASPALSRGPRYGVSGAPLSTSPYRVERTTAGHVATSVVRVGDVSLTPAAGSRCRVEPPRAAEIVPCGEAAANSSYDARSSRAPHVSDERLLELRRHPVVAVARHEARGHLAAYPELAAVPGRKGRMRSSSVRGLAQRSLGEVEHALGAVDASTRATRASSVRTCSTACSW